MSMHDGFNCLIHTGIPISDRMRDLLFNTAMDLAHRKEGRVRIKGKNYEGEISTTYEYVSFGAYSGIRFTSVIETPAGTMRTEFLVSPMAITQGLPAEAGIWEYTNEIPAAGPARNASLN